MTSHLENLTTRVEDCSSLAAVVSTDTKKPTTAGEQACNNNPLSIDLILANMFELCDFELLAQCRRVTKQWFKGSLPAWLNKAPKLKLHLDPNIEPDLYHLTGSDMSMSAFLQLVHNEFHSYGPYEFSGFRQYQRFKVVGNAPSDPVQHHYLQQFLKTCGKFVTELTLEDLELRDCDTYQAVLLSTMSPNLVKLSASVRFPKAVLQDGDEAYELMGEDHGTLKSLKIYCYDSGRDDWARLPASGWMQLLKRYPNLKTILLGGVGCEVEVEAVDRMLEAIGNIRQSDKTTLDLRRLEIRGYISTGRDLLGLLPLFRNTQLSLETLGMSFGDNTPPQDIYEVLALQASTLRKLVIHKETPIADFKPPELPLLESLELHGMLILNFGLLNRFQSLNSLFVTLSNSTTMKDLLPISAVGSSGSGREQTLVIVVPTLTKLHFHYGSVSSVEDPAGPEDVAKLASLFPNLKDFQMWLTNESLGPVLQSWPGLEHLNIVGVGVDDDGISGVILDLPRIDLKCLAMWNFDNSYKDSDGPAAITDKSLAKFLELPKLERLEVTLDAHLSLDPELLRNVDQVIKAFRLTLATKSDDEGEETHSDAGDDDDIDGEEQGGGDGDEIDDSDND